MRHIKQVDTTTRGEDIAYTVVITTGYGGVNEPPLEQHPSIVENPTLFVIVDQDIPSDAQYLNYI